MKTLKLDPAAFNEALQNIVGTDKVGWSSEDHARFVEALKGRLTDEDGIPPALEGHPNHCFSLVFRPTEELQRRVLNEALELAGYTLDGPAAEAFALLFGMSQFTETLVTKINSATGKTYITREKKGKKTSTFDMLVAPVAPPAEPAPATAPLR